ncbi:MAG: hypothetical protein K6E85_06765 [Lachnospiraceae bacterium]|nr:hypothetical protein [Lachnospiraceae bacterium]
MKKITGSILAALLFAFIITAISGFGSVKASAATLTADLDGDGTDDTIEYEISGEEYDLKLDSLAVNGTAVKFKSGITGDRISVSVFDSCTKDGIKEVLVTKGVDSMTVYYLYRYKNGKVSKYCEVEDDEIISQKKKNRITTKGYVFVFGIGNIRVTTTGKVKSGKLIYTTDTPLTPNKDNEKVTFKTNQKITLYSDEYVSEEIGSLKKGAKFKLVKFLRDGEGRFTRVCVKSNGVTGWIDTSEFDYSNFLINNPPVWD